MDSVVATELKGRDEAIQSMKDVVMAAKTEKEEAEARKKALEVIQKNVESAQKNLDKFKSTEKERRLKLEGNIVERLEKKGAVVLEGGGVLATPHQMKVEMKVRSQQLSSATEELRKVKKELDSTKSETEKELRKKDTQLQSFRRARKTRLQNETRNLAREMKSQSPRCWKVTTPPPPPPLPSSCHTMRPSYLLPRQRWKRGLP
jgi:DNA repair exonuclease SbcCD ATPase subunit